MAPAINATLDLPELLNLICRESASLFQVQTAFVWLVEGDELVGFAAHGQGREEWLGRRGLRGEEIPLAARIFAVADVWDALRSDRSYRPAWPEVQVLAYLQAQAGEQLDPQVVEVFVRLRRIQNAGK